MPVTSPVASQPAAAEPPSRLISVHLNYILGTLPLLERFAAARSLGFNAVEFPFPYDLMAADYAHLLEDNGLQQISLGAPACDYAHGAPGFSLTPALQDAFDRSLDCAIVYATTIKCRNVHVFAGGVAADMAAPQAFDVYCRNLQTAHDRLQSAGLRLVIEPINNQDFSAYFMNRLDFALAAIERADRPDIGIILDVYHASMNDENPDAFLRRHGGTVAHIQLADFPGRHEPGTGAFNFSAFLATVRATRYGGSIGLEYVPTRSVFEGVPLAELIFPEKR